MSHQQTLRVLVSIRAAYIRCLHFPVFRLRPSHMDQVEVNSAGIHSELYACFSSSASATERAGNHGQLFQLWYSIRVCKTRLVKCRLCHADELLSQKTEKCFFLQNVLNYAPFKNYQLPLKILLKLLVLNRQRWTLGENTWVMGVPGILSVDQVYSPLLTMTCRDRRPLGITRMQTPSTPGWEKDLAQPTFSA